MDRRQSLHQILTTIEGVKQVYFQRPPDVKMEYPCIVYNRDSIRSTYADCKAYYSTVRYKVTVIDTNPDSEIHLAIRDMPMAEYDRFYTANGLNHDVFNLYF